MGNFTFSEMFRSETATKQGIDNTPPIGVIGNINRLMVLAEEVRALIGSRMSIKSGYRCKELNKAVKGEPTSLHIEGLAIDFIPLDVSLIEAFNKIKNSSIQFEEVILEPGWIHIALPKPKREKLKAVTSSDGKRMYLEVK